MNYEKPEVVKLESALSTIQGQTVKPGGPIMEVGFASTVNAYEADE
jgi:hypothetical protein